MSPSILGRKIGMTQIFLEDGTAVPVTVVQAGPCHVLQVRSKDRDGYEAVQMGFEDKPRRLAKRSERGQVATIESKRSKKRSAAGIEAPAKADCEPQRFVREFRGSSEANVGDTLTVEQFNDVKKVDITGTSKGRGFAGVMKRHNFAGQRATHGVKKCHRHAGGTGMSASPSRTFKGKRMAGQYGNAKVTTRNLEVVRVDAENNLLMIRGAVPGPNGGFVSIRQTNKVG
ncbi:50S ribosomal protein L3 [Rhodopirellula baltica]|uniref:Large ribosomal subunit protein uL3 n=3 Tax=Rhodopirellula baltica TaxID=265606 RepID=RL3_RHOBA|nr:50S ribosomal protein L3 [Rhodopirellula baltica]Q7UN20.1 RecName: Full=Large ribosomal subunit protein uL3; AltName: Full=50S ribosomal protein L3 [Rhodopirellula baltica SH 1]CAD75599.1 50S ribosomal protein L3 [Rhodopirellula baltica SH 1]HBE65792.1 50S ribosomal protein L3 [Rhodopirellula baltica]